MTQIGRNPLKYKCFGLLFLQRLKTLKNSIMFLCKLLITMATECNEIKRFQ